MTCTMVVKIVLYTSCNKVFLKFVVKNMQTLVG